MSYVLSLTAVDDVISVIVNDGDEQRFSGAVTRDISDMVRGGMNTVRVVGSNRTSQSPAKCSGSLEIEGRTTHSWHVDLVPDPVPVPDGNFFDMTLKFVSAG